MIACSLNLMTWQRYQDQNRTGNQNGMELTVAQNKSNTNEQIGIIRSSGLTLILLHEEWVGLHSQSQIDLLVISPSYSHALIKGQSKNGLTKGLSVAGLKQL